MKLGSHNSMTYLKPKKWWMYPFLFIARCQNKDILTQYGLGARWFDLRVSFNNGNPEFRHGLVTFKGDFFKTLEQLNNFNDIIVSITLEKNHPFFYNLCEYIEKTYTNIKFVGGQRKSDWKQIYEFQNQPEYTSISMFASSPDNPKWYGICPFIYSWLNRKKINNNIDYLIIDYIGTFNIFNI